MPPRRPEPKRSKKQRRVVVIGGGKMGTALMRSSRARAVGAYTLKRSTFLNRPKRTSDGPITWILALRDGGLAEGARKLSAVLKPGDVVLHLAGMLGPEVLSAAKEAGAAVASMHPAIAIAEGNRRPTPLYGGVFAAEGDAAALREAKSVARDVYGSLVQLKSVDRARYHGAAALVATGGVAIAQGATALFASASEPAPNDGALRAMVASLLRSVANNVLGVGAERALASPLLRDDTATVKKHLEAMGSTPEVQALYRAAVALVVETLDETKAVKPETIAEARRITGASKRR